MLLLFSITFQLFTGQWPFTASELSFASKSESFSEKNDVSLFSAGIEVILKLITFLSSIQGG